MPPVARALPKRAGWARANTLYRLPAAAPVCLPPARNGEPGLSRLLVLAQCVQVGGQVVGRGEGVGMVVT
jgi:hypothetical protein